MIDKIRQIMYNLLYYFGMVENLITIAICDDNETYARQMVQMADRILKKTFIEYTILSYFSAKALLQALKTQQIDILLLDIELNDANGIDVAKVLGRHFPTLQIIYMTAHIEFADKICMTKFQSFIVKPVTEEKLQFTLKNAAQEILKARSSCIHIVHAGSIKTINTNEIFYCESQKRVVYFHTLNGRECAYMKISELEEKLPDNFCRVHKSYIVNFDYVAHMSSKEIQLENGMTIPIPQKKYTQIKSQYIEYISKTKSETRHEPTVD